MKAKNNASDDKFKLAYEAIGNLLLPELNDILQGGWSAALAANSEIKIRPISQKKGPFNRHLLPLLKDLASVLSSAYRRYFKLALAHPQQSGPDPHEWALHQFDGAVRMTLEWIRDWYILACDGSNQYMQPVASIPFQPGQTVSTSIPLNPPEIATPESWRAPAWLFAVGLVVGIGPLKDKNVPARDSEEKLSAAHTRLLLKGARRVFLWKLAAEIEIVRNQEIADAGSVPAELGREQAESQPKKPKYWLQGVQGLTRKAELSQYTDNLTEKQRLAFSLKYEFGLGPTESASRMGIDRSTFNEHLQAANKKIEENRSFEKRKVRHSKLSPDE